jgi:hypothetical protein
MVENLILNLTSFISGVFVNDEEDLPLRKQGSKEKSSLSRM